MPEVVTAPSGDAPGAVIGFGWALIDVADARRNRHVS